MVDAEKLKEAGRSPSKVKQKEPREVRIDPTCRTERPVELDPEELGADESTVAAVAADDEGVYAPKGGSRTIPAKIAFLWRGSE